MTVMYGPYPGRAGGSVGVAGQASNGSGGVYPTSGTSLNMISVSGLGGNGSVLDGVRLTNFKSSVRNCTSDSTLMQHIYGGGGGGGIAGKWDYFSSQGGCVVIIYGDPSKTYPSSIS
jgi:hypothetical protein